MRILRREGSGSSEHKREESSGVCDAGGVDNGRSLVDLRDPSVVLGGDERARLLGCSVDQCRQIRVVHAAAAQLRHRVAAGLRDRNKRTVWFIARTRPLSVNILKVHSHL